MKNKLFVLSSILLLALSACGRGGASPQEEDDGIIHLQEDTSTSYNIDSSISNANGSMSYEIFVRSFYDTNNDGIGDLNGVTYKLDYLKSLGIKTIWLMPIMPSPSYHGYDVSDYYNVHSDFGTLADFDNLVTKAREKNIDIMIDMVLNHCSSQNNYFKTAKSDYKNGNTGENSKANWFTWSDRPVDGYHSSGDGLYYESRFDGGMPDFNLDNQAVRNEIENIVKFWIQDHGVKGFRLDAVLYYYYQVTDKNVEFLSWLEDVTHKYDPNFYMVGEAWDGNNVVNSYYNSKCDSFFRFDNSISGGLYSLINFAKGNGKANTLISNIEKADAKMKTNNPNGYSSFFLSNHDQDRISRSFNETQNKVAAQLYCLLPGTPFMYYGEEIQLVGTRNTGPDDLSDVRRRLPMIWSKTNKTGECQFPEKNRQDLNTTKQVELGVDDKLSEPFSLVNHYRYVISIRNKYPLFKQGVITNMTDVLETEIKYVCAYKISLGNDYIIVVHNLGAENVAVTAPGTEILDQINTSHLIPELSNGKLKLAAQSTVIMR